MEAVVKTISTLQQIGHFIGNTPLLEIHLKHKGEPLALFAKYEAYNFSGSIKDRMAYHIVKEFYNKGSLKSGDEIVEATSGNTGIAFAALGAALGHPVTIFMPNWMSSERVGLIKSYGANVHMVSKEEGGFLGSIQLANEYANHKPNTFQPHQFDSIYNQKAHYISTGPEIVRQIQSRGLEIDAFVAGVGTGGTIMGVGAFLKEQNNNVKLHPLEPSNSPTLSTGHKVGKHRIQGISDEFIPSIVKLEELDEIIAVDDGDAIIMAQKLTKSFGLGLGISSGANFLGAIKAQEMLGNTKSVVATVFCDSNKKYISTDLTNKEPVRKGFISTDVELISFNRIN